MRSAAGHGSEITLKDNNGYNLHVMNAIQLEVSNYHPNMDSIELKTNGTEDNTPFLTNNKSDPYKELELYLDKVTEEIGQVFTKWKEKDVENSSSLYCHETATTAIRVNKYRGKIRSDSDIAFSKVKTNNRSIKSSHDKAIINHHNGVSEEHKGENVTDYRWRSTSLNKYRSIPRKRNEEKDDFSERFLSEFNDIVAKRLLDLKLTEKENNMPDYNLEITETESDPDYDEVFDSEEDDSAISNNYNARDSRSRSLEDARRVYSCESIDTPNYCLCPNNSSNKKNNSSRTLLSNFLGKSSRNNSLTIPSPGDAVLVRVVPLPDSELIDPTKSRTLSERRSTEPNIPKNVNKLLKSNGDALLNNRKNLLSKSVNNSPIPKHKCNTIINEPWPKKSNKIDTIFDRNHHDLNNGNKCKDFNFSAGNKQEHNKIQYDPILEFTAKCNDTNTSDFSYKTGRDLGKLINVNIEQIRAGLLKNGQTHKFPSSEAIAYCLKSNNSTHSLSRLGNSPQDTSNHQSESLSGTSQPWNKTLPSKLQMGETMDNGCSKKPEETFTEGAPTVHKSNDTNITHMASGYSGGFIKDAETQTHGTPSISRSSSCTWISECSSTMFNTGSTNASVSDDEIAVDDDIRSSSSSTGDGEVERDAVAGEESGIGTASPPPSRQRKETSEKGPHGLNKCKRKETWERLRRRLSDSPRHHPYFRESSINDVWVRRESVTTQTISPDDMEHLISDNTCNTEDNSSNENLLLEDPSNDTSISENSLRRNMFQKKYNEINQSTSGIESNNSNIIDETTDNTSVMNDSVISLSSSNSTFKTSKTPRPTHLRLNIKHAIATFPTESPTSSGDALDDSRTFRDFVSSSGIEQPSPSSASLKSSLSPVHMDLGSKCSSVPVLMRRKYVDSELVKSGISSVTNLRMPQKMRAQSEKQLAEIEAAEACKWLRAAGFPQYAQMYEDMQFPINVSGVQSDHPFLDNDSLQSLFRRLTALNRCADMKLEHSHPAKHTHEESDEENQCALSDNWQFERKSRRWSRVVDITPQAQQRLQAIADRAIAEQNARDRAAGIAENPPDLLAVPGQELPTGDGSEEPSRFRRTGSERLRDGAKAFLRRVESIKSKRRKRQNRENVIISSPQVFDVVSMEQKMKDLNCIDISPTANIRYIDFPSPTNCPTPMRSQPHSPLATMPPSPMTSTAPNFVGKNLLSPAPFGDDSSSYCSDGSHSSAHRSSARSKFGSRAKKLLHRNLRQDDSGALSDSECQPSSWRHHYFKDANSNNTKVVLVEPPSPPEIPRVSTQLPSPPSSPKPRGRSRSPGHRPAMRAGSLNLGKDRYRDRSFKRDKSASRSELSGSQDSGGSHSHDETEDKVTTEVTPRIKGNVQRWHSFQRSSSLGSRPSSHVALPVPIAQPEGEDIGASLPMAAMSCGQLHVLRKLALLKLTACMEKHCPTHRSGWNWELPKFIRKIKAPDYKDKTVFGVPLLVSLQRSGHALPKPIQTALRWLRNNALDQVGLFRKAGVRSRTLRLRQLAESAGATNVGGSSSSSPPPPPATLAPYDEQQAHDVADMVKQYFRELPDALLTNKLSETFIAIFQHVPPLMREDAVQCALLLLPEEHREALQVFLAFLQQVADHSATNQMTASNLAVCLAPTLLRLHHSPQGQGNSGKEGNSNRSASASPRRKRGGTAGNTAGAAPDPKELNESRAAHDCLLMLIKRHRELFTVSAETLHGCKFNSLDESIPLTLEELGSELEQDWQGFQQASTQALLKEAREKSRGWVSVTTHEPHVDLCYRKVGDGHPLRLWRVTTEVEAPPTEVLHRILRERHIWDDSLLKWRVVERLNPQAEVFQYLTASMAPLQAKDYCVLRSWQSDLPRGGCCVVETSVSHAGAPILLGGVRAVVLASRYLIEPAGKGRSRLMHLARVDTKGRTPEWYNKSYGHICALYSARIRASFKHNTDGPESNV